MPSVRRVSVTPQRPSRSIADQRDRHVAGAGARASLHLPSGLWTAALHLLRSFARSSRRCLRSRSRPARVRSIESLFPFRDRRSLPARWPLVGCKLSINKSATPSAVCPASPCAVATSSSSARAPRRPSVSSARGSRRWTGPPRTSAPQCAAMEFSARSSTSALAEGAHTASTIDPCRRSFGGRVPRAASPRSRRPRCPRSSSSRSGSRRSTPRRSSSSERSTPRSTRSAHAVAMKSLAAREQARGAVVLAAAAR
jgi:hypothetical protein